MNNLQSDGDIISSKIAEIDKKINKTISSKNDAISSLKKTKHDFIASVLEGKMADFKGIKSILITKEIAWLKRIDFQKQYFTRVKCKDHILYFFSNKNSGFDGYFPNHVWVSEKDFPHKEYEDLYNLIDFHTIRKAFFSAL